MKVVDFNKTIQEMLDGPSQLEVLRRTIAVLTRKQGGRLVVTKEDVEAFLAEGSVTQLMIANTDGNLVLAQTKLDEGDPGFVRFVMEAAGVDREKEEGSIGAPVVALQAPRTVQ